MSKSLKMILILIAVILVLTSIILFLKPETATKPAQNNPVTQNQSELNQTENSELQNIITQLDKNKSNQVPPVFVDKDQNGIDDSVDDFIRKSFPKNSDVLKRVEDLVQTFDLSIQPDMTADKAKAIGNTINTELSCLTSKEYLSSSNLSLEELQVKITISKELLMNTPEKKQAYVNFNRLLDGQYYEDLGPNACNS